MEAVRDFKVSTAREYSIIMVLNGSRFTAASTAKQIDDLLYLATYAKVTLPKCNAIAALTYMIPDNHWLILLLNLVKTGKHFEQTRYAINPYHTLLLNKYLQKHFSHITDMAKNWHFA